MHDLRKGWFVIPSVQDGDRTFEEQFAGLEDACVEAVGKTVADLGCAEGLISAHFALNGAKSVIGVDILESHLVVAREQFGHIKNLRFVQMDLRKPGVLPKCDIVIACGVCHKMNPGPCLEFVASRARKLLLFRNRATDRPYLVSAKYRPQNTCQVDEVLEPLGFREEKRMQSTRGEAVQYWRRA